jgi:hypothetical protein
MGGNILLHGENLLPKVPPGQELNPLAYVIDNFSCLIFCFMMIYMIYNWEQQREKDKHKKIWHVRIQTIQSKITPPPPPWITKITPTKHPQGGIEKRTSPPVQVDCMNQHPILVSDLIFTGPFIGAHPTLCTALAGLQEWTIMGAHDV